jgi:hypothetical protein
MIAVRALASGPARPSHDDRGPGPPQIVDDPRGDFIFSCSNGVLMRWSPVHTATTTSTLSAISAGPQQGDLPTVDRDQVCRYGTPAQFGGDPTVSWCFKFILCGVMLCNESRTQSSSSTKRQGPNASRASLDRWRSDGARGLWTALVARDRWVTTHVVRPDVHASRIDAEPSSPSSLKLAHDQRIDVVRRHIGEHLGHACPTFGSHIDHGQVPARLVTRHHLGGQGNRSELG